MTLTDVSTTCAEVIFRVKWIVERHKTDDNWNISSRPLDKTETQVLSYGLKRSVTPKHIPTEAIVSSVEAVLSRQRELSESAKDNIRSRIASTIQSSSLTDSNLTKDERQALKRMKTDENIVILPADKGRVTVVMDKTDYYDKMDTLVNDKQTYEELKRDPTPSLQRKLNSKLLDLKKTDVIDIQRYNRLRCRVPQPPKLYGLPKLHKPNIPIRLSLVLWVPDLRTIQILDDYTETVDKRIPTQTTVYRDLYWRYQDSTFQYLTTTNLCLLMWNRCSPVFHFNWL